MMFNVNRLLSSWMIRRCLKLMTIILKRRKVPCDTRTNGNCPPKMARILRSNKKNQCLRNPSESFFWIQKKQDRIVLLCYKATRAARWVMFLQGPELTPNKLAHEK